MFGFNRKHLLLGAVLLFSSTTVTALEQKIVVGQTFLAGNTDPTDGSAGWALTSHGVAEKLFTVDKNDEIVPQVAESVRKVSDLVWELTLKSGYKFSDGTPVNAQHVADCLNELNEKNSNAQTSLGKMTVTPSGKLDGEGAVVVGMNAASSGSGDDDDLKVNIESTRPTHVMDAVLAEWAFVVYLKDPQGNFIYTGPYAIDTFAADELIELKPNRYYDKALERPKITVKKFANGHVLAEGLENGEVDIGFHLPIDTLPELRKADGVRVKSFEVGYHYMMFHNLNTLQDVRVRKAIDLAIDRTALSQALAGGKGTRSLFPDYSPYFLDDSDAHGDADAAAALLDEAGWALNPATGKREKNDEELTVHVVAYPHRPGLVIMQPVIEETLKALGMAVDTTVTGQEWSETQDIIDGRGFDLLLWAQHTLPAGDPLWFLSAFFRSDGGNNHANFASEVVDSLLDTMSVTEQHEVRVAATEKAHRAILDEVPVSNLVTPYWHVGLSERMADYEPWGSDYYVIRPDLFVSEGVSPSDDGGMSNSNESGAFSFKIASTTGMMLFAVVGAMVAF